MVRNGIGNLFIALLFLIGAYCYRQQSDIINIVRGGVFLWRNPMAPVRGRDFPSDRQILSTYIRLMIQRDFMPKKYNADLYVTNLFGFSFYFPHYNSLLFLFDELFIQKNYVFYTQKANPIILDCGSNLGLSILFFKL